MNEMNDYMGSGISLLIMFIVYVILILPFWKITKKAGYPGWLSLLMTIPLINFLYLYFLGFSDWPSLRKKD